ncbi:Exportin-5 [Dirofilaria immitis]
MLFAQNQAASVGADNVEHYRFLKMLCNVLSSLGIHLADVWTQRPPNFGMYLAAIEAFFSHSSVRERFMSLSQILQQVPGCSIEDVQRLDQRIASMKCNKDFANEKMKREIMKKLLRTIIATSVGEQHRRPIYLRPLPPILKNKEYPEEGFTDLEFIFGDT